MSRYVSVKGWLECEDSQVGRIKRIISDYKPKSDFGSIFNNDNIELYNKGWCYQKEIINWTSYIFYGADIKEYYLEFIKEEIKEILRRNNKIDGMFFFSYEEDGIIYWKITDSKITECEGGL